MLFTWFNIFLVWFLVNLVYRTVTVFNQLYTGSQESSLEYGMPENNGFFYDIYEYLSTINTIVFYLVGAWRICEHTYRVINHGEELNYATSPHYQKNKIIINTELPVRIYPILLKAQYRSLLISLKDEIDHQSITGPNYHVTQNIRVTTEKIQAAFASLRLDLTAKFKYAKMRCLLGNITIMVMPAVTKNDFQGLVDDLLGAILKVHLEPFKSLPLTKVPVISIEKLSAGCTFIQIKSFDELDENKFVIKLKLPEVLDRKLFRNIQIPGFVACNEPINRTLLQTAILAMQYRYKQSWRNQLEANLDILLTMPKSDLTVLRVQEWGQLLKHHLIELSPSVMQAKEVKRLLLEIPKFHQERSVIFNKINKLLSELSEYANSAETAGRYEDKIPREYYLKYVKLKKLMIVQQLPELAMPDDSMSLIELSQLHHQLLTEFTKLKATFDELNSYKKALCETKEKYLKYLTAQSKVNKTSEVVAPSSMPKPVPIRIIEPSKAKPAPEPMAETPEPPTVTRSCSSSSSSSKPALDYNDNDLPVRILHGDSRTLHFERPIEQTLIPQRKALYLYAKYIISKIIVSKDQLIDQNDGNVVRRKAIYRLIDQFACLDLALQEMVQQNMLQKNGILAVVHLCRNVLRHNAVHFIHADLDQVLNVQLGSFVAQLQSNLDKEIRNSFSLTQRVEMEVFAKTLKVAAMSDEVRRIAFIADLEFIENQADKLLTCSSFVKRQEVNLDFYTGLLSQLGNHLHAYKQDSTDLFQSLVGHSRSKLLTVNDFRMMNRDGIKQALSHMHPGNLLYLCLQIRNIRGHEIDTEMILPLYQIGPQVAYVDSLCDDVKEAVFVAVCVDIAKMLTHVKQCFLSKPTLQAIPYRAVESSEFVPGMN